MIPANRVTRGFFEVFGVEPLHGRTFTPDEFTAGRDQVVVLSHGTWADVLAAIRRLSAARLRLNGQPYTIVGILPADVFAAAARDVQRARNLDAEDLGRDRIPAFAARGFTTRSDV